MTLLDTNKALFITQLQIQLGRLHKQVTLCRPGAAGKVLPDFLRAETQAAGLS